MEATMKTEEGLDGEPFEVVTGNRSYVPVTAAMPVVKPMASSIPEKKDQQASLYAIETVDLLISFLEEMIRKIATIGWDRTTDKPLDKFVEMEGNRFKQDFLGIRKLSPDDKKAVARLLYKGAKAEGRQQEETKKILLRYIFPGFII